MEGETQAERKSRLAELAKAIKAKKTDISKNLEKVNSDVKKSLSAPTTVRRKTSSTVLEEVARLDHEIPILSDFPQVFLFFRA